MFLVNISVILLENFRKDLFTLPSKIFRVVSQFTFSKSVISFNVSGLCNLGPSMTVYVNCETRFHRVLATLNG